jgi:hypothetical protein
MIDMNIREFYVNNYPTDDLGIGINPKATFAGLLNQLIVGGDVYEYLYVYDSIVRERLFERLAEELEVSYEYVYKLWLNN